MPFFDLSSVLNYTVRFKDVKCQQPNYCNWKRRVHWLSCMYATLFKGLSVIGIDCITDYYDIKLKNNRLRQLTAYENYTHLYNRIEKLDAGSLSLGSNKIIIVHLAAQAGVRHSIDYPKEYAETNLMGTFNILEIARELNCKHLLVASTSSVYGNAKSFPLAETFHTSTPLSFYAATKIF